MTSELPNSDKVGGEMRGRKPVLVSRDLRGLCLSCFVLLASIPLITGGPALAQNAVPDCGMPIGRVISVQGTIEVQRAGTADWRKITRLDTMLCAGDRLRTDALSRAALFVQPETLVRVDQNTTIEISQTPAETLVEFHTGGDSGALPNAQSCGAGYFITRFPRKFRVSTPHMNAAVEGTEFMVESSCKASTLTVIEGQVLSQSLATNESRSLTAGQRLESGPAGGAIFSTVVRPVDAVQWVLRFPQLSDANSESGIPGAKECLSAAESARVACLTGRAEVLLRLGRVDAALEDIDEALSLDGAESDANALRAIIQVAKNDKAAALQSAAKATAARESNSRAWLALSYAQQASFELEQALESARIAQGHDAGSSLIHARVAELLLAQGYFREAEASARSAVAANPDESQGYAILGFSQLAQIDIQAAKRSFQSAIERDSFSSLPRLGLGLAAIREGRLTEGREQLEIAVALDPSNSLLRSYVGKAYFEENSSDRDALAATQFALARDLDANDPTPWFFDAILKSSQTRPVEALRDLDRSTELNDGRAVFRSRQLLDQDLASRGVNQAYVYNELGFQQLGVTRAAQSLSIDPGNGAAHRFLADIYSTLPRYGIARASELLQAQLRQPLGAPPLLPQLANDALFRNTFSGPATAGFNEFNTLFLQDGLSFQFFGLAGSNDTYGDQAILSGLHGPFSFSLSQFASDTDGYRPNNDDERRQYDGFAQWQLSTSTSAQFEINHFTRDSGDLQSAFDPVFFSEVLREEEETDTQRFGLRHVIDPGSDIQLSVIRQDRQGSLDFPDPVFPAIVLNDQESWKAEAQYMMSGRRFDLMLGASYFDADGLEELILPPDSFETPSTSRHINAYGYLLLPSSGKWPEVQVGVSYDDMSSEFGDQSELNPKFGLIWRPSDTVTLRAAGFGVLKRRLNSDQGLEPTQLAGFNQFFDDRNGSVSEGGGIAADLRFSQAVSAGLQATRRNVTVPLEFFGDVTFQNQREDVIGGYLYWVPDDRIAVSIAPRHHDLKRGAAFSEMELTELPIEVRFSSSSGLLSAVSVTGVDQKGAFTGPGGIDVAGSDDFWLVNAMIAYRLPRRMGTLSLHGENLLDEDFQFQEIDQGVLPRYVPDSQFFFRVSLGF